MPRLVFASSIAVFGAPFPEAIGDEFFHQPLTSYGTQKAIGELLVSDYSRKGFVDGISLRLPTICVRPGKPNKAASGFFSNIMREPLAGAEAVLPVSDSVMHWHASPRAAVQLHAARGHHRHGAARRRGAASPCRASPSPSASRSPRCSKVAGDKVVARIRREPDPFVEKIVAGWPRSFAANRAHRARLQAGRELRGDHSHPHRGRAWRPHRLSGATIVRHAVRRCRFPPSEVGLAFVTQLLYL